MTQLEKAREETTVQAEDSMPKDPSRPWPVTALALLLLLQSLAYFGFGLWRISELNLNWGLSAELLIFGLLANLFTSTIFVPLSLLGLWAAVGFLRVWSSAWLNAMLLQGLSLLTALIVYFNQEPGFVFIIMGYSIVMVIYLLAPDVQNTFRVESAGSQSSH